MKKDMIDRWLEQNTGLFAPQERYVSPMEEAMRISAKWKPVLRYMNEMLKRMRSEDEKYEEALLKFRMGFTK